MHGTRPKANNKVKSPALTRSRGFYSLGKSIKVVYASSGPLLTKVLQYVHLFSGAMNLNVGNQDAEDDN
jgi:hypothetical protein